jgi:tetratricopeptide (TPR) repeat protein
VVGLTSSVAHQLGIRLGRDDPVAQLGHALAARAPLTLVLDNFERLVSHADAVGRWRAMAPTARLVVTSRVPLDLVGERIVEVDALEPGAARELLVARAAERGAALEVDAALDELARRLDYLPLALELAAGRLGVLTVSDVLERLGLGLLRTADEGRHATLRIALDWSWSLLEPTEREVLAQLAVFAGGFSVEAVEAVVEQDGHDVLDIIEALVTSALVTARPAGRFDLLSSIQEYALHKLDDPNAAVRHGRFFAALDDDLAAEMENLVAACQRAVARRDEVVAVATLQRAWQVLSRVGPYPRGLQLVEAVRSLAEPTTVRHVHGVVLRSLGRLEESRQVLEEATQLDPDAAEVWLDLGTTEQYMGRLSEAELLFDSALRRARTEGDRVMEAQALACRGAVAEERGDLATARKLFVQTLALCRSNGSLRGVAMALNSLGRMDLDTVHGSASPARLEEAQRMFERLGDRSGVAMVHSTLAAGLRQRDLRAALRHDNEALRIHQELGERRAEAISLGNLGVVMRQLGKVDEARDLYARALRAHEDVGATRSVAVTHLYLSTLHRAQGELEPAERHLARALQLFRDVGDKRLEGNTIGQLGSLRYFQGRLEEARVHWEEAVAAARECGDSWTEQAFVGNLGVLLEDLGDTERARAAVERALELARSLNDGASSGFWLVQLAGMRLEDTDVATAWLDEALDLLLDVDRPEYLARLYVVSGEVRWHAGDLEGARAALAEGERVAPDGVANVQDDLDRLRVLLG